MKYNCALCGCWFVTEKDLAYHYDAHEKYGTNLPSARMRTKKTIRYLVDTYKYHIETQGRGYQSKITSLDELSLVINYKSIEWADLSNRIKAQRNYECEVCGGKQNVEAHHIIPAKHTPEDFLDIENLIVLCKKCHKLVHEGYNEKLKEYAVNNSSWINYDDPEHEPREEWRVCKHCGKSMYSKYKQCYECWEYYGP